ncbi:MAG: bifunctional diaminohydroxyphosphoribosylaminopyrimidine deaminase/5-amino-6-(5-phosphoribosylamino)uracil reductase RibD [Candidatus Kapabacteria bacterium]|nr:bifunctional diaminohydroxyphosphoribosylaminopyrimidine deaminase/5-amino-6-(5-phosphoribosylamino)uracil reductase RibD [Candidatus Kapabacteria bacterium]
MTTAMAHEEWMRRALQLAQLGSGHVAPNPMVGCVIVRENVMIAEGWHAAYGELHAETDALRHLGGNASGATMYINLEPCTHYGKQPPCVDAIVRSGVERVVLAMTDPNPVVSGRGVRLLQEAGIEVVLDVLRDEAEYLNRRFAHWMTTGLPHVTLKIATSLDSRAQMPVDQPRYITSAESRYHVHKLRSCVDAVMIGIGTALHDNPELTVRLCPGRNPVRVVIDSMCRLPTSTKLVETARETPTIILCSDRSDRDVREELRDRGVDVVVLPTGDGTTIATKDLLAALAVKKITSVLAEGGPYVAARLLREDFVDELHFHAAPIMIGSGPTWVLDTPLRRWNLRQLLQVGSDVHVQYVRSR